MPEDATKHFRLFMVDVVSFEDDHVLRSFGPFSQAHAPKVADRLKIDRQNFYTVIRRANSHELHGPQ